MTGHEGVNPVPEAWLALVGEYRVGVYRGEEVVQARLLPHLTPDAPEVRAVLAAWEGPSYVHRDQEGTEIVLVRSTEAPEPIRWILHATLFLLTAFTTHMAGALLQGVDPMRTRFGQGFGLFWPYPTGVDWDVLAGGAVFAVPFLGILLAHESGHYVAARLHRIRVTPPFFIPFPAYYSIVGTLGAFIRIKGPTVRRSILFDVGAAGPYASFFLSIPVLAVGLSLSHPGPGVADLATPFLVRFADQAVWIGNTPLTHLMGSLAFPDSMGRSPIVLHPLAFAGWLGLFLTALNLLPLGQLDGGHILYALLGDRQEVAARVFLMALLPLGFLWWGWWFWGGAAYLVNRGRLSHPPVIQPRAPIDARRRWLGWIAMLMFFLALAPVPIRL
ncbi:MAG: site-2 protease family protein [Gemmatimonadetes bacterium]|nr:site-2 protease family protein [Gemmatimonadota bacterium]